MIGRRVERIRKIISGGQTGVDRAALDFAFAHSISCGGWCPRGRRAEDGCIPERYSLKEAASTAYAFRTQANVRDSDATLILSPHALQGGTRLTWDYARALGKPVSIISSIQQVEDIEGFAAWGKRNAIETLNVAGPRASEVEHAYRFAWVCLHKLFNKKGGSHHENPLER